MLNIPVESEEFGWQISALFYQLSRPQGTRMDEDCTQYYCEVVQEPVTQVYYLRIPLEPFAISVQADYTPLFNALAKFASQGLLPLEDIYQIKTAISDNKGKVASIAEYIPEYWKKLAIPDSKFS